MKIDLEWLEELPEFVKENWKMIAFGVFFVVAAIFGESAMAGYDFPALDTTCPKNH